MSWSYRKNLIGKVRIYYSSGCVGPVQIPLDELADELNDYEARIAELEAEPRWISVRERLPEFNKVVAVIDMSDKDSHLCNVYETAILVEVRGDTRFGFIGHSGWDSSDVTHWMPLPKLPEVQG